ncbi:hypothetical protein [Flavilitoribacter nigricans]|uniref:Uncharacterized protein n=1 Tax=Flavilitoribacter nigricans (strain ATCC 23147 / DSM 23189 / NBRC 102662 / NCIMB 1420 / SS-2) TaxID=1122177 RepID=A0A2D0NB11_FLAN2|nr:hypothetical protein [Flavilitoribacter nigricans]PHN05702.1 hypothetical protein CRP01_14590 [Flavilitoribacter nigricans DSM 23189 = NBRC 102662]
MSYTKISNLTFSSDVFFEPGVKFYEEDINIVKANNAATNSFELRNASYSEKGSTQQAMVLIGLDADDNPLTAPNDLAVVGCPPGRIPGKEINP